MCWVNVEPTQDDMMSMKMNLAHAIAVEEFPKFFRLNYPGEGYYRVRKTPEMIEAYNSLVPEKSQPVVPAEPDPTEWVVQDKVPYRHGIDQRRWVIASTGETHCGYEWGPADCDAPYSHGEFLDNRGTIQVHLRCRPDQLPKLDEVQP